MPFFLELLLVRHVYNESRSYRFLQWKMRFFNHSLWYKNIFLSFSVNAPLFSHEYLKGNRTDFKILNISEWCIVCKECMGKLFPLLKHSLEICNFLKGSFFFFLLLFPTKNDITEVLEIDLHATHHKIWIYFRAFWQFRTLHQYLRSFTTIGKV